MEKYKIFNVLSFNCLTRFDRLLGDLHQRRFGEGRIPLKYYFQPTFRLILKVAECTSAGERRTFY